LRTAQISAIDKDWFVQGQSILLPYGNSIHGRFFRQGDAVGCYFHFLRGYKGIMSQHKIHICRRHAADVIRKFIQADFFPPEILVEKALFREHPQIHRILRKDILQQQVGNSLRIPAFQIFHDIREGDGRRGIQYQLKIHASQVTLDGFLELFLYENGSNPFFNHIRFLDIQCPHSQKVNAVLLLQHGRQLKSPLTRIDHVDIMPLIPELAKQIRIDSPCFYMVDTRHCQENHIHKANSF